MHAVEEELAHQKRALSSRLTRGGSGSPVDVLPHHKLHTEAENLNDGGCTANCGRNQADDSLEEKDA